MDTHYTNVKNNFSNSHLIFMRLKESPILDNPQQETIQGPSSTCRIGHEHVTY